MLDEVIRLRNRGLSVFPVSVTTKKPAVSWDRYQEELPTEDDIHKDFAYAQKTYGECAVGVACGPVSNLFLLDFDFEKHPEAREFFDNHEFPRTWVERTRSGGIHIYFKWCDALNDRKTHTASKLWPGVDTRGYGGYSKICPSPGYEWIVPPHMAALAEVPEWLIDLLPKKENRIIGEYAVKPTNWMIGDLMSIVPGDGQNGCTPTFTRAIGRLKGKGLSAEEAKFFLTPWAMQHEYARLDKLVDDQYTRYPQRAELVEEDLSHSLLEFMVDPNAKPYIVPGLVAENTINILAGLQESRKSWLSLDLAVSVATGTPWLSKFPTRRMRTMIIDQERPKMEMQRRIASLTLGRNLTMDSLEGWLIPKVGTTYRMNNDESYTRFAKLIDAAKPELIVIDSLKAFQNGDICSNQHMQQVFERFKALRTEFGVTFVILHHENKGAFWRNREKMPVTAENIAGAAAINEVPEGIMVAVNHGDDSSFVHHVKNSYGTKLAPFMVKVRDITPDRQKIAVEAF